MSDVRHYNCSYADPEGHQCPGDAGENDLCKWHDPAYPKDGVEISRELEIWAHSNRSMQGFQLAHAVLDDVNLVNRGKKVGYDLSNTDLYHASLRDAHLFQINLSGSSLIKADFSGSNLNCADLTDANLLGAIFDGAKLEHVTWGEDVLQERLAWEALDSGDQGRALDYFEQAEEIYRNLRLNAEIRGHFNHTGAFFHKEMIMRRLQLPRWSSERLLSKLVDLFCGYGERPDRVIFSSMVLILGCAVAFFLTGVNGPSGEIAFSSTASYAENLRALATCCYYSVVTFTTLGYGDIVPVGWTRLIAAFEAFTGAFTVALFVVVFVKKMAR